VIELGKDARREFSVKTNVREKLGKGRVLNHSRKTLLVIENDSGKPIAHLLGPKRKTPSDIDADGFRRSDGATILGHKHWWKIIDISSADIWQIGSDFLIPVSLMLPVSDGHFGKYKVDNSEGWGEKMAYVTARIQNKRGKVIGYVAEGFGRISKTEAIRLVGAGKLDNVVVATSSKGTVFLRTKKNMDSMDNLSA
jgi:hypothetical protein